jgi:WD40 repeat protein
MTNLDLEINEDNPWVGLREFTEEIQSFFHGREGETESLLNMVQRRGLTVLFGQSGLGKSSLLQAGLFPRLRAERFLPVYIRLNYKEGGSEMETPTLREQVKEFITREVSHAIERGELSAKPGDKPDVSPGPRADESVWRYLHRRVTGLRDRDGHPVVPVLVFDQFEEIFTVSRSGKTGESGYRPFLRELADCVENRLPEEIKERLELEPHARGEFANLELGRQKYRIMLSLREDYVGYLDDLSEMMPSTMENRMRLLPLDGRQAMKAVVNPGRKLVKPPVARRIVRFVAASKRDEFRADDAGDGEAGEELDLAELKVDPALLSMVCSALNKKRLRSTPPLPEISEALLKESSKSILRDFYTDCFREPQMQPVRKFVEEQLLTASDFRDSIELERAKAELHKLGVAAPASALERLIKQRLLRVVERHSESEPQRLELTHDILTGVVSESRRERHHLEQVEAAERGRREREAQVLRESEDQRREAEASRVAAEKQLRRALAFAALAVVTIGVLVLAVRGQRDAARAKLDAARTKLEVDERAKREADELVHEHNRKDSTENFDFALLRSGMKLDDSNNIVPADADSADADSADLRGNVVALTHLAAALTLGPKNSDAARLTVKLLSKEWCQPLTPSLKYPAKLTYGKPGKTLLATTWAPDGKIVSLAEDGTLLRADAKSPEFEQAAQLDPRPGELSSAAFSADGKWLLTVSATKVRLWKWNDASPGKEPGYRNDDAEPQPFTLEGNVRSVACSPDGKWLVITAANPAKCVVRNLAKSGSDAGAARTLEGALQKGKISAADFSADGKFLLTGSTDGLAALWNPDEPAQPPKNLDDNKQGGIGQIISVAVNPAKAQFVAVSWNNVRLWNLEAELAEQKPIFLPNQPRDRIIRAAFSRDGNRLITGTMTGVAQIWDTGGETTEEHGKSSLKGPLGEPVWHLGTAGIGMVSYIGFSPAGDAFVTCVGPTFTRPESLRFWSGLPRSPLSDVKIDAAKKPVPKWLPEMAQAVSGLQWTAHGYESTSAEQSLTEIEKKIPASSRGGN